MSDIMKPLPFSALIEHALKEYKEKGTIFNVKNIHSYAEDVQKLTIFNRQLENPLGVAAGPHTQLAQNIVACYAGGARFIELKTIQIMYGEELGIPRPCIRADDEAYNVEWSSEYSPAGARDEYIKAWVACKVLAKELKLGDPEAVQFNMSAGYDLKGIQSEPVDTYINDMRDASMVPAFQECINYLHEHVSDFENIDLEFIDSISPQVCTCMTVSTMHGTPADQIEDIINHLLVNKKINTYLKCNPTLLGYERVRSLLDSMNFDYIEFGREQFEHDLKFDEAVPMLTRLMASAEQEQVEFGVKLTNTFQCKTSHSELPGTDMYMSGKSLYPLAITVAHELSKAFEGKLPMSYCGGADKGNIAEIYDAGLWPVTVCTVLLRGQGYNNLDALAKQLETVEPKTDTLTSPEKLGALVEGLGAESKYSKGAKQHEKAVAVDGYTWPVDDDHFCKRLCKGCVNVCPNRANEVVDYQDTKIIVHIDSYCNECGNCQFGCIEPCRPYRDRWTFFDDKELFENSTNDGILFEGDTIFYRCAGQVGSGGKDQLPEEVKSLVDAVESQLSYHLY